MSQDQRFSQACENNKGPILQQLKIHFSGHRKVLEIGSGTGQHAAFFASNLTHLEWLPTDVADNHPSIHSWLNASSADNWQAARPFFIGRDSWPDSSVDAVFTANTAHIMQASEVQLMMQMISQNLPVGGTFCQYGPFCIDGNFTSASNAEFHQQLIQRGCGGIRDIAELQGWASTMQLQLCLALPANNHLLVWRQP